MRVPVTLWKVFVSIVSVLGMHSSVCASYLFNNVPRSGITSTYGDAFDSDNTVDGYRFTVGSSQLAVLSLGMMDNLRGTNQEGLFESHQVGLWTSSGTLLASVTVGAGTSAPLIDGFRYVNLNTAVLLNPGQSYVIAANYTTSWGTNSNADLLRYLSGTGITTRLSNLVTFDYGVGGIEGAGFVFPTQYNYGDTAYLGGNAFFVEVPVPQGAALAGVGIGVLFFGRRFKRI